MKFIFQVLAIMIVAFVLELFLPWYYIAVAAFIGGYILKSKANFLAGFLAIGILWSLYALLQSSVPSSLPPNDLADRVAKIFTLPGKEWLILITGIIGGLVGGFAALTGSLLKRKARVSKR
jgi:hypothetical protein